MTVMDEDYLDQSLLVKGSSKDQLNLSSLRSDGDGSIFGVCQEVPIKETKLQ